MNERAESLVKTLQLERLEGEGGYFRRIHTFSEGGVELGSVILYLMTSSSFSSLHYLPSDEVWYFLEGSEAQQLVLYADQSHSVTILGPASKGLSPVVTVKGGCWQGTRPIDKGGWTLCATTMVPPFDGRTYRQGTKELVELYPECPLVKQFLSEEGR